MDIIASAENLVARFGPTSFDLVVATEVLEHIRNWRSAISSIKHCYRPGGIILVTTRSRRFPFHMWPYDFWRYELEDMKSIFSDSEIILLESDTQQPGVFAKVRKPVEFNESDLSEYELYSVIAQKRTAKLPHKGLHFLLQAFWVKIQSISTTN